MTASKFILIASALALLTGCAEASPPNNDKDGVMACSWGHLTDDTTCKHADDRPDTNNYSPGDYTSANCDGRGITPSTECLEARSDYNHFPAPRTHGYRDVFEEVCYTIVTVDLDNRDVHWTPHERRDVYDSPLMKKCVAYLSNAKSYGDLQHRTSYGTMELDLKLVKRAGEAEVRGKPEASSSAPPASYTPAPLWQPDEPGSPVGGWVVGGHLGEFPKFAIGSTQKIFHGSRACPHNAPGAPGQSIELAIKEINSGQCFNFKVGDYVRVDIDTERDACVAPFGSTKPCRWLAGGKEAMLD